MRRPHHQREVGEARVEPCIGDDHDGFARDHRMRAKRGVARRLPLLEAQRRQELLRLFLDQADQRDRRATQFGGKTGQIVQAPTVAIARQVIAADQRGALRLGNGRWVEHVRLPILSADRRVGPKLRILHVLTVEKTAVDQNGTSSSRSSAKPPPCPNPPRLPPFPLWPVPPPELPEPPRDPPP